MNIKSIERHRTKISQQKKINELIHENERLKIDIERSERNYERLHAENNRLKMETVEKWKFHDLKREFEYLKGYSSQLEQTINDKYKDEIIFLRKDQEKCANFGFYMILICLALFAVIIFYR